MSQAGVADAAGAGGGTGGPASAPAEAPAVGQRRASRLIDIAEAVGVHVSTVSRVLNGDPAQSIRPEVYERILATARPGEQWWAIVKVMYFGRLQYSEPVEVTIV